MNFNSKIGSGIVLIHKYPKATGLCTVLPTDALGIDEGFYPLIVGRNIYTGNIDLSIDHLSGIDYDEMERLTGDGTLKGSGVGSIMTKPIWGFKRRK